MGSNLLLDSIVQDIKKESSCNLIDLESGHLAKALCIMVFLK